MLNSNRYACLTVDPTNDIPSDNAKTIENQDVPSAPLSPPPLRSNPQKQPRWKLPKWEKRLPQKLVIATTRGDPSETRQLQLPIALEVGTIPVIHQANALVDSGAAGCFINRRLVEQLNLTTRELSHPRWAVNVDGTDNAAGSITHTVEAILHYRDHSEKASFMVTLLGDDNIILGYSWLREHNPSINWETNKVELNRCPARCTTCKDEMAQERRIRQKEKTLIRKCRAGGIPSYEPDWEETLDEPDTPEDEQESFLAMVEEGEPAEQIDLEPGNRLFATTLSPPPETIRASQTMSQKLAEAATMDAPARGFEEIVPPYLHDLQEVFAKESFDELPDRKPWDHAIELVPGSSPSSCKVYPLAPKEQGELDMFIQENLQTGRIHPSKSLMASPVFFIKKKDGSLCLVQDYRTLNAMTIKNRYPLPLISELVNNLKGARYFTKLDVRWGYNNVRIKHGDEWKAAFWTNRGLFEPLVMFFGLTNSPATFQTMMNDIFQDLIAEGVVCVYLDDILIFTQTAEEHRRVTRLVLERLQANQLYLKPEKCEFEQQKVEYLGLIISHNQVEMDPVKVAGVVEWPEPRNKKEVQSFLGFVNFYRRFIQDFSHHARPLFALTRKDAPWQWTSSERSAFDKMKSLITAAPVLALPSDSDPYRLEADSSDFATGAVLSQLSKEDGKWHPVAFYSKSLSPVERNYEIHDKEMLAVIRALEEWRHFLEGAKHQVEIWTDHKNLEYFRTS